MSASKLAPAAPFFLALGALFAVACDSGEPEVRPFEFAEERLRLFSRLDEFTVVAGLPGNSPRYLQLVQDPERTEPGSGLRLRGAPTSTIASPALTIPNGARLELGVGLEWLDELAPDEGSDEPLPGEPAEFESRFVVSFRPEGGEAIELGGRQVTFESHAGPTRVREDWTLSLDPAGGRRGRLEFSVEQLAGPVTLNVVPAWWGPAVVSPRGEAPASLPRRSRSVVLVDLLERVEQIQTSSGAVGTVEGLPEVELGRTATDEPIARRIVGIEPHFQVGSALPLARGGTRPALAFAESAIVEFGPLEPRAAGANRIVFAVGVHPAIRSAPELDFYVRVAVGDEVIETRGFERADFAAGWSEEVEIELPRGSRDVALIVGGSAGLDGLAGLEPFETTWNSVDERGLPVSEPATFERAWVAIARPRLVREQEIEAQPAGDPARPSVLVLCAETLRADVLDPWGGSDAPELDRWADRALVFERAYSPSSWTLPSTASLLTGLSPGEHGAVSPKNDQIGDWSVTLAEAASAQGIRTGAFVTNELLRRRAGFAEGFDTYVRAGHAHGGQITGAFLDWLSESPDERFFAYLHFFEPHTPCNAPGDLRDAFVPEELAGRTHAGETAAIKRKKLGDRPLTPDDETLRYLRGRYRGEVRSLDRQLGAFFDELDRRGVLASTLVAFVADHGEEFGEHGWYGHGPFLYDEGVWVPLMLLGAGVEPGRVAGRVEVLSLPIRVGQTLGLEEFAGELRKRRPGLPLGPVEAPGVPIWLASEQAIDLDGWSKPLTEELHRLDNRPIRAAIVGDEKVILRLRSLPPAATPEGIESVLESFELYDVEADPRETTPLSRDFADVPEDVLAEILTQFEIELAAPAHLVDDRITSDTLAVLQGLGYLGDDDD